MKWKIHGDEPHRGLPPPRESNVLALTLAWAARLGCKLETEGSLTPWSCCGDRWSPVQTSAFCAAKGPPNDFARLREP